MTAGDILESARKLQGLERMDQIKFAILEANGDITIVPGIRHAQTELKP